MGAIRIGGPKRSSSRLASGLGASVLCVVLTLAGCSGFDVHDYPYLPLHVIAIDEDGQPYNPMDDERIPFGITPETAERFAEVYGVSGGTDEPGRQKPWDDRTGVGAGPFDAYLRQQFAEMGRYFEATEAASDGPGKRRILIHVHGGMVSPDNLFERAAPQIKRIMHDKTDPHYPVFVSWPSGWLDCYTEQTLHIRKGTDSDSIITYFGAPFYFLHDLSSGIVRLPIAQYHQTFDTDWFSVFGDSGFKSLPLANLKMKSSYMVGAPWYEKGWGGISYFSQMPIRWLTTPFVDGMGRPVWRNMIRRTRTVYRSPEEFDLASRKRRLLNNPKLESRWEPTGALALYFLALESYIDAHGGADRYEITLVGHSMGALVLNELLAYEDYKLRANPDVPMARRAPLPIRNIVYMSPACTIRDAEKLLVPYLKHTAKFDGPNGELSADSPRFYLLALDPVAEAVETQGLPWYVPFIGAPLPKGSLLEWIDSYYNDPVTPMDATFGKLRNLRRALHIFSDVDSQVSIKSFDVHGDSLPQRHGDFNLCPFWRRSFWEINGRPALYSPDWAELESKGPKAPIHGPQANPP